MGYDFSGNIYQASANNGGVSAHWHCWGSSIFFERFKQKMAQQHRIIPGHIGIEFFERQLLMAEIFQGSIRQFITASLMVAGNNPVCGQTIHGSNLLQQLVNGLALANIGNDNRIGATSRQAKLVSVIDQAAANRPPESIPIVPFAAKLNILPVVFLARTISDPCGVFSCRGYGFDVLIKLAATEFA